jgi:hypothetical protein
MLLGQLSIATINSCFNKGLHYTVEGEKMVLAFNDNFR